MKRELFFLLLIAIGVVLFAYSQNLKTIDNFQNNDANPTMNVPLTTPDQKALRDGDPEPFAPASTALLAPPPGQTASVNSYPAQDPALEKSNVKRINNVLETLNGFLRNEAVSLKDMNDPSVQLPLETARADVRRLTDEVSVLKRNPGIESSLTQSDINHMESNLNFLQKKWRLSANAVSGGQGSGAIEGFQNSSYSSYMSSPPSFSIWKAVKQFFNLDSPTGPLTEGFASTGGTGCTGGTGGTGCTGPVSQAYDYGITCPAGEYSTLSGSPCVNTAYCDLNGKLCTNPVNTCAKGKAECGTSSPNTRGRGYNYINAENSNDSEEDDEDYGWGEDGWATSRRASSSAPATLTELKNLVSKINVEIIRLNASGSTDPLTASRVIALQSVSDAVSDIIRNLISGAMDADAVPISKKAIDAFLPVMSNMNTPLPSLIRGAGAGSYLNSLFPVYNAGDVSGANFAIELLKKYATAINNYIATQGLEQGETSGTGSRGMFEDVTQSLAAGGDGTGGSPSKAPQLDWKNRSKQICDQVKRRGLNPEDYGCMQNTSDVGQTFSFRGYAKMICARLATNYDPGIPELCGCPPPTWAGWRL